MTRKDYIKIAAVLKEIKDVLNGQETYTKYCPYVLGITPNEAIKCSNHTIDTIVTNLSQAFFEDNSRFDSNRFKKAVNG